MVQGLTQVAGRMQHIRRYNEVIGMGSKPLRLWRLFDIQQVIAHKREGPKLFLCLREKRWRDVGEDIFRALRWQMWQQMRCRPARPGANFQNAHSTPWRYMLQRSADGLLHQGVHHLGPRGLSIKPGSR